MAEFTVFVMLESDMEHAFLTESCAGMTPTDTQKNVVYYVAKQMAEPCGPEEFGIAIAKQFVSEYPLVSKAKVTVEMKPWKRIVRPDGAHDHGFIQQGTEIRTGYVEFDRTAGLTVHGGLKELRVLKTTQTGYEGFLHDRFTTLPDVRDRIVATSVTATWRYSSAPPCFGSAYESIKSAFLDAFYGPAKGGVYSPSVQYTLYQMAKGALEQVPQIDSVFLNMPNLHFMPCAPVTSSFDNDVFVATSEPHGNIEAVVTRKAALPHAKL